MKLEIKNLSKTYGTKIALDNLNITFSDGIYGMLGANGAGKSTMMNLITDNIKRECGEIRYEGKDILTLGELFRKELGYMPQQHGFYEHFSAMTFLYYMAELKGLKRKQAKKEIELLLETLNLSDVAYKKIGGFSGGMKQRVMLAQALLGNPKIVILDEPTAGLDPKERIHLRNYISDLSKDKIIILATHVVSDIECIADKVILMKYGALIKQGTPKELIESLKDKVAETSCTKEEISLLQTKYPEGNIMQRTEGMVFRVVGDTFEEGFHIVNENIGLEDVYLYYCDYYKK